MRETMPGPSPEEGGRNCRGEGDRDKEQETCMGGTWTLHLKFSRGSASWEGEGVEAHFAPWLAWRLMGARGAKPASETKCHFVRWERKGLDARPFSVSTENSTKHCHIWYHRPKMLNFVFFFPPRIFRDCTVQPFLLKLTLSEAMPVRPVEHPRKKVCRPSKRPQQSRICPLAAPGMCVHRHAHTHIHPSLPCLLQFVHVLPSPCHVKSGYSDCEVRLFIQDTVHATKWTHEICHCVNPLLLQPQLWPLFGIFSSSSFQLPSHVFPFLTSSSSTLPQHLPMSLFLLNLNICSTSRWTVLPWAGLTHCWIRRPRLGFPGYSGLPMVLSVSANLPPSVMSPSSHVQGWLSYQKWCLHVCSVLSDSLWPRGP